MLVNDHTGAEVACSIPDGPPELDELSPPCPKGELTSSGALVREIKVLRACVKNRDVKIEAAVKYRQSMRRSKKRCIVKVKKVAGQTKAGAGF